MEILKGEGLVMNEETIALRLTMNRQVTLKATLRNTNVIPSRHVAES